MEPLNLFDIPPKVYYFYLFICLNQCTQLPDSVPRNFYLKQSIVFKISHSEGRLQTALQVFNDQQMIAFYLKKIIITIKNRNLKKKRDTTIM